MRKASSSRPALSRVHWILDRIRRGDHPNATTLAREYECVPRTIQRDIECLRDQLGAPIAYDAKKHGYRLTDDRFELPRPRMTAADLAAFLIAERAIEAVGPRPLADTLRSAREKLAEALPAEIRLSAADQSALIDYRANAPTHVRDDVFAALTRAVTEKFRLRISYRSATRGGARTDRAIDPYGLVTQDGSLYVLAWCHRRKRILCFAASRIDSFEDTRSHFERPADFSPSNYMNGAFRVFVGEQLQRVRVWFSSRVAIYLRERPWHPSQQLESRSDGSIIARFDISYPDELIRWVMSWGPDAEVLTPKEVRSRARELFSSALRRYREPSSATPVRSPPRKSLQEARRKSGVRQILS